MNNRFNDNNESVFGGYNDNGYNGSQMFYDGSGGFYNEYSDFSRGDINTADQYGDLRYHGDNQEEFAEVTVIKENTPDSAKLFIAFWLILTAFGFASAFLFNEPWLLFPVPVQLITGIVLLAASEPKRRTKNVIIYILLLAVIGAALAFLRMSFPLVFSNMKITGFYDFTAVILGSIGGALAAYNALKLRRMKRNCTVPINALVADHLKGMRKYNKVYDPVYIFTYGSKKYKTCENRYYPRKRVPNVGEMEKILIDPQNPKSVYVPKRDNGSSVLECILGIFILLCGMTFPLMIAHINMSYS